MFRPHTGTALHALRRCDNACLPPLGTPASSPSEAPVSSLQSGLTRQQDSCTAIVMLIRNACLPPLSTLNLWPLINPHIMRVHHVLCRAG